MLPIVGLEYPGIIDRNSKFDERFIVVRVKMKIDRGYLWLLLAGRQFGLCRPSKRAARERRETTFLIATTNLPWLTFKALAAAGSKLICGNGAQTKHLDYVRPAEYANNRLPRPSKLWSERSPLTRTSPSPDFYWVDPGARRDRNRRVSRIDAGLQGIYDWP